MATMDVFRNSAFSTTSLSGVVEKMDYVPGLIGSLNLFDPVPVRTRNVFVDRRESGLSLIRTSADGSAPENLDADNRDAVPLRTVRLAKGFTLYASELDGIRAHGTESELEGVQGEYLRRMSRVRSDMELTHEFHRLAALQGKLLDADGSTVIYDYHAEFGEAAAAAVSFTFSSATFNVRGACQELTRSIARSGGGSIVPGTQVHALVGDAFYDALIDHDNVRRAYENWSAAADLRENKAFQSFSYGGITWHNYRGTNDNSTVAVAPTEAKFFPVGARDVFVKAMSPLESMEYVNTPGRDVYAMNIMDRDRNMWAKGEVYSYPLYLCQRPGVLRSGVAA